MHPKKIHYLAAALLALTAGACDPTMLLASPPRVCSNGQPAGTIADYADGSWCHCTAQLVLTCSRDDR